MNPLSSEDVYSALATVIDPELRKPLTDLDMVKSVDVNDTQIRVTIALTIVGCPASERIENDVRQALLELSPERVIQIDLTVMDATARSALLARLRGNREAGHPFGPSSLTRVIAVTSGKGGVGKSSVTANLAVELAARGRRVGVIDADVFGFSLPALLGISHLKPTRLDDTIVPPIAHEVKLISIGMFVEPDQAVSWRGPMLHRTVTQFLSDVYFGDLDVLLLDLPPGTGDVAISIGQLLPHAEVLVVTTPQRAAASVAIRSAQVARQTGQTVIGVVETMSATTLPDGSHFDLFGEGGGQEAADALGVPLLAKIPLSRKLREGGDSGVPVILGESDDPAAEALRELANALEQSRPTLVGVKLPVSAS